MSHDQPPRQPLAPPFSRPTHPGPLPAISPDSEAGRPLRPTPYANAVIPTSSAPAGWDADIAAPADEEGAFRDSGRAHPQPGAAPVAYLPGEAGVTPPPARPLLGSTMVGQGDQDQQYKQAPSEENAADLEHRAVAGRSLRDLPGDHGHPTGVPANPEPAVEAVDAIAAYPVETSWSSEAVFGWGTSESDRYAGAAHPSEAGQAVRTGGKTAGPASGDIAHSAAAVLESLAESIRRGELRVTSAVQARTPPAILAAVLATLLARPADDQWAPLDAREASAAEQAR